MLAFGLRLGAMVTVDIKLSWRLALLTFECVIVEVFIRLALYAFFCIPVVEGRALRRPRDILELFYFVIDVIGHFIVSYPTIVGYIWVSV